MASKTRNNRQKPHHPDNKHIMAAAAAVVDADMTDVGHEAQQGARTPHQLDNADIADAAVEGDTVAAPIALIPAAASDMAGRAATTDEIKPRHLLELPAELRVAIYSLLLVFESVINVKTTCIPSCYEQPLHHEPLEMYVATKDGSAKLNLAPNILATCHQISNEAAPVLYGQNHFNFTQSGLERFAQAAKKSAILLRKLGLVSYHIGMKFPDELTLVENFGLKLSKLSLGYQSTSSYSAEQMAADLLPLLRAQDLMNKADNKINAKSVVEILEFLPWYSFESWHLSKLFGESLVGEESPGESIHRTEWCKDQAKAYCTEVKDILETLLPTKRRVH